MSFLHAFLNNAKSAKDVVSARRMPGRVYVYACHLLDRLGVEKITIVDSKGIKVTGYTSRVWEYLTIRDKKEYEVPGHDVKPGDTVVDVGANQGFFTLYAANKGARVIAVEPSPINFRLLKENIEQNNLVDQVVCVNCAVSDTVRMATMYEGFSDTGRYLTTQVSIVDDNRGGSAVRTSEVRAVTLDEVFASNGIEACDLLKMDCEGSEYAILSSTSLETFRRIKAISFEFHEGRVGELKGWLEGAGFEIVSVKGDQVGLMKARRKAPH